MTAPVTFDVAAAETFLRRLWRLDAQLVAAGFHETSPWWREQLERFVRALPGGVQRAVIRAGRRAGKSSTISRLAVAWALWGAWHVPAGDIGCVMFVSVSRDEAGARLRTISAILDALHIRYSASDGEIEVGGARPVLFRVAACTVRSVVGPTAIMLVGDEVARWESRDTAANPASEVFASLSPTLASQPYGFAFLVSSPWGSDDYHAQRFEEGDSAAQITAYAPTWVANPTITEARTHELEPDPRIWAREYAAEPGATVSAAFDPTDLAACFRVMPSGLVCRFVSTDASSLRGDDWTYIEGGLSGETVVVTRAHGWGGDELRHVSMADVVRDVAQRALQLDVRRIYGDQREEASLTSMFREHGLQFRSFAWSEPSKDTAMQSLRRLMRDRRLILAPHAQLRAELSSLKARLMPSGRVAYHTNGLDYASALITLAHAIDERDYRLDVGPRQPVVEHHSIGVHGVRVSRRADQDYAAFIADRRARLLRDQ